MKYAPISIIIPTLNEEKALPILLNSIRRQSVQPKEIIVADAYSKDKTREIAHTADCIVVNGGMPGSARNIGAKIATQPLLIFLDADVVLPNKFIEKTVYEFISKKYDLATCFIKTTSLNTQDKIIASLWNYYFSITRKIDPHACGFCLFVKKSIHTRINGFDESIIIGEDVDYVKRSVKFGKFGFIKSKKVIISMRRFKTDGRMKVLLTYLGIELHRIFVGKIRKKIFDYPFGEHKHL